MRWLAFVALLSLSGCAELMGGCGEPGGPYMAQSVEPALYGELPGHAREAGFAYQDSQPSGGIPFVNVTLRARWGNNSLEGITWSVPSARSASPRSGMWLNGSGSVEGILAATVPDAEVRAVFLDFARKLSAMDDANLSRRADAFAASHVREDVLGVPTERGMQDNITLVTHRAALAGPWRAGALFAQLEPGGQLSEDLGVAILQSGDWSMQWNLTTRSVTGTTDSLPFQLVADRIGHASFLLDVVAKQSPARLQAARNATYAALGLPAPAPADFRATGPVC